MRYFVLTTAWAATLAFGFLMTSAKVIEADPTDDFNFSTQAKVASVAFRTISEQKVSEILTEKLDLFPKSLVPRLSNHILSLSKHHRFDPVFILSVIEVESRFKIKVKSPAGAVGLMQIMIPTADFVVNELDFKLSGFEFFKDKNVDESVMSEQVLMDPFINTAIGIAYLAWLRDHYQGSPFHLLAAYNLGPAKLDGLLAQKSFEPVRTKQYFHAVRRGVVRFSSYQGRHSPHEKGPRRKPLVPRNRRGRWPFECLVDIRRAGCYQEI